VVKAAIDSKNLTFAAKPVAADVFYIAVPTPYRKKDDSRSADMTYVASAAESILPVLKKGDLVILESTSPAGTTRDLIAPLIEKKGFRVGPDVGLAYCPERVIPGQSMKELIGNDRVVGAVDEKWAKVTKDLYRSFVTGEIFLTEPTVAEMVKLLENTYRDVNIALANEVAIFCEKLRINAWDVIRLANRHPRVNVHKPGPGVGGHCIGVDPWFLVERFPGDARLIRLARSVNDHMPEYVSDKVAALMRGRESGKVAVLGLAYKGNVDDDRESPAVEVVRLLKSRLPKVELAIYDPHVKSKEFPMTGSDDAFKKADLVLLLTAHDEYKALAPSSVAGAMSRKMIFDTHNILKTEAWTAAGFELHVLGIGTSGSDR
jgi:UDP-N-acetyl-D-mannosaminuronic acid dehydrogenase